MYALKKAPFDLNDPLSTAMMYFVEPNSFTMPIGSDAVESALKFPTSLFFASTSLAVEITFLA
ncbi:MAG: hypothetical protein IT235_02555 [Bacteroidia bacterium]|nr:hypothetical protein [Bacteroidia bacterium]